jgi:hypothetical protein
MCDHKNTEMIRGLPGVLMCASCGKLFDAYSPQNSNGLFVAMDAQELSEAVIGALRHLVQRNHEWLALSIADLS